MLLWMLMCLALYRENNHESRFLVFERVPWVVCFGQQDGKFGHIVVVMLFLSVFHT